MSRLLLVLLLLAAPASADDAVDWSEAPSCINRVCSLRGTVVEQEDGGAFYRLYFSSERRDVYITLMRGWLVTWPDYVGHAIVATGPVDRWRDHAEMILLTPDAIALLDAPDTPVPNLTPVAAVAPAHTATAVAPTAAPVSTDTPIAATPTPSDEVERLRERVRTLEEKIERLEGGHPETP